MWNMNSTNIWAANKIPQGSWQRYRGGAFSLYESYSLLNGGTWRKTGGTNIVLDDMKVKLTQVAV